MAWGKVKEQDFVGKEAHVRHREEEPAAVMCTLTVDDHTASERACSATCSAASRSLLPTESRSRIRKGRRSFVTSAGAGPSVGKHILLSYLPPEHANVGRAAGG